MLNSGTFRALLRLGGRDLDTLTTHRVEKCTENSPKKFPTALSNHMNYVYI